MKKFICLKKAQMLIFALGFISQFSHASNHCEDIMEKAVDNLSGTLRNIVNQADICSEIIVTAEELSEKPNTNLPFVMKTGPGTALDIQYQEQQQKRRENKKNFYMAEFMIRGIEAEKNRLLNNMNSEDREKLLEMLKNKDFS